MLMQVTLSYSGSKVVKANGIQLAGNFQKHKHSQSTKLVIVLCGGIARKRKLCEF